MRRQVAASLVRALCAREWIPGVFLDLHYGEAGREQDHPRVGVDRMPCLSLDLVWDGAGYGQVIDQVQPQLGLPLPGRRERVDGVVVEEVSFLWRVGVGDSGGSITPPPISVNFSIRMIR